MFIVPTKELFGYNVGEVNENMYHKLERYGTYSPDLKDGYENVNFLYVVCANKSSRILARKSSNDLHITLQATPEMPPQAPLGDYILVGGKCVLDSYFSPIRGNRKLYEQLALNSLPHLSGAMSMIGRVYVLTFLFIDDKIIDDKNYALAEPNLAWVDKGALKYMDFASEIDRYVFKDYCDKIKIKE